MRTLGGRSPPAHHDTAENRGGRCAQFAQGRTAATSCCLGAAAGAEAQVLRTQSPRGSPSGAKGCRGKAHPPGDCHHRSLWGSVLLSPDASSPVPDTARRKPETLLSCSPLRHRRGSTPVSPAPHLPPAPSRDPGVGGSPVEARPSHPGLWLARSLSPARPLSFLFPSPSFPPLQCPRRLGSPWLSGSHGLLSLLSSPPGFLKGSKGSGSLVLHFHDSHPYLFPADF